MVNIMLNKKSFAILFLLVLFIAFFIEFNVAYAVAETAVDTGEVLEFLNDVVELDLTKYEAILLTNATNSWPWLGGISQTTGQYRLDSTGLGGTSILTVTFTFWDKELISCSFYEISQGPALYRNQPVTDLRNAASSFLQKYQTRTGDAQLTQMRNALSTAEVTSNTTKTIDNMKLEVFIENDKTLFTWSNTVNGADYSRLILKFQGGQFSEFNDDRKFYKLGSSDVNISEEEAVNIALEHVKSYSYKHNGEEITNFGIVKEQIRSRAEVLNRTERTALYPCWIVDLPLNKTYPGSVAYIELMIWADSGKVISCEALGYGFPSQPSPTPSTEDTRTDNSTVPPIVYIVSGCAAIAISIAIVAVALKKRSK